jgi:hypothetical protein
MKAMEGFTSNRMDELMAGAAAGDLSAEERAELASARASQAEQDELMRVAALAQLAFLLRDRNHQPERLSGALRARLLAAGRTVGRD